jgi:hypothetical protein
MALVFFHVELDPLTRLQLRQAAVTHRTEVDEDILAPVDSDEPLPLLPALRLHGPNHDHASFLTFRCTGPGPDHNMTSCPRP